MNSILMELEHEGSVTAKVLERVPEEHLAWKPHAKSMSLGQLALHIASTPSTIVTVVSGDTYTFDPATAGTQRQAASRAEIMKAHSESLTGAKQYLSGLTAEQAGAICRLSAGSQEVLALPRAAIIRSLMLNHWYHHRGQLTVYLRLLNVAVPSVYGPSADENPFVKSASA